MAKRNYHVENLEIDDSFFADAINSKITEGKAYFEKPSMSDYIDFYGSTRGVALELVNEGVYTNVKSAMRQVQRLNKNPNIKTTSTMQAKIATLSADIEPTMISIVGKFSYDGFRWAYGSFDYTPTQGQMRGIVYASRTSNPNRNQESLDAFMDAYGVGMSFMFAKGVDVEVSPMSQWGHN